MPDQAHGLRALADIARRELEELPRSSETTLTPVLARKSTIDLNGLAASHLDQAVCGSSYALADISQVNQERVNSVSAPRVQHARVIAITSGKGGVGKTSISTNLALMMAKSGQRVVVLDADLGLANLHIMLGVNPKYHLQHVISGEKTLGEVLYPCSGGIMIVGGGSGMCDLADLDNARRDAFLADLSSLDEMADVILLDTGAGLSRNVISFLCAAEEVVVLSTPEPTSLMDAYATIKVVSREAPEVRLGLVVNMARTDEEARATKDRMIKITKQYLKIDLDFLGSIPFDVVVPQAVRAQKPFTTTYPNAQASRAVEQIASHMGYRSQAPSGGGISGFLNRMQNFGRRLNSAGHR